MRARFTNAHALHQCYIMQWTNGRAFILHQQFTLHTYLFRPPLEIKKERYPAIPLFLPSRANPNRFFTKRTRSHARTCTRTRARRKRIFSPSPNTFRLIFIQRRRLLHFSLKLSLADSDRELAGLYADTEWELADTDMEFADTDWEFADAGRDVGMWL